MKGKFISFEGIDGCGKTTQIKFLEEYLLKQGYNILVLREPGGTKVGEKVRDILLDKNNFISPVTEMLLYASSRAQLVEEKILPAIEEGKIVLLDRFVDSSYVYQGYARGLGIEKVKVVNEIATMGILPDVTIYIDITPEEAMKRRGKREADRLERESWDFHKKVREGYIKLVKEFPKRFVFIDGMQELMKVHKDIIDVVKKYL
ncbi:MAG: Thymidylate kinase [Caldanaerobacter subterraneus]|jgi:dTMP kinase|uniref:Thymidylate kinase n=3 Tax=Thermoanaerobacter TaxID=1754 RepID=KTHY_THEP3|nr:MULTISPECIES: dTMP kinase [Thermoanaerobacter]B0K119.1 RecName: Full=Thymidylate kinase; AltName: Full=dTMP kinase [Thermoanaerobacter sp. X514]B0K7K7.1 RecName: Full=Thymidylate kinase; AltName: Full=dTMP kinase [Thermoanaerobacter pseudethanolicus ATCC 33223]KUJ91344.1 MAG: dTMP kinase [Thermoanaerobacter thermocopriae]KUK35094.1 MAG: Thymidylate kinase [Caldanaerobacter subterraneus]ABY91376.1 dTMP kinase [Thermoanaerobacter sp. X514]ABY95773.1 dTMP kinase [Thermoanaerobacter pseudethan